VTPWHGRSLPLRYAAPPMSFEHLLSPLAIGPVTLRNRIVSSSHQTTLVADHLPTDEFVAYQAARAAGETGLIIMEAVAVAPSGLLTAHTLGGYLEPMVDGYRRVAAAVQPHGCKLFVQLFHGGREQIASAPRAPAVSSSALPSARYHTEPRALRTEEVQELIASYGRCAEIAAAAGLDGIEVTAAHGYLGEQFFRPEYNLRTDRYAEPARFVTEALEAVRAAAPGLALGVRLSADSAAARAIVPELAELVDYVHLAIGNSATFDGCTGIAPPPPTAQDAIGELTEPFKQGRPLIATTRVVDPAHADTLVGLGTADAFGMTRALITDPEMPRRARTGDAERILRCIGCNACIAHYHAETPIRCSMNPRTGRELTLTPPAPGDGPRRRVVIVGAGPAGLAAAVDAGAAGHDTVLLERADAIGGQVTIAASSPGHAEQALALAANYTTLLRDASVSVRLGTTASAESIAVLAPDLVILATGAAPAPARQPLDGIEVLQAWDVLAGRSRPSGHVIVSDWGGDSVALDCAEVLAADGCQVTIAVGAVMPGESVHQYARNQYLGRLARAGVTIADRHGLLSAAAGEVTFANVFAPEVVTTLRADGLVLSHGRVPEDGLYAELLGRVGPAAVVTAGDCRSPRGLEEAILEGTLAARDGLAALAGG
jgi:2,4-dienoyl-CoA reductase-like NADH-dependent reductase (Old Yellow Enzyme family)/thioredoxin reductase